jgi:hypothetical protein
MRNLHDSNTLQGSTKLLVFLYQNKNPEVRFVLGRQFCASLNTGLLGELEHLNIFKILYYESIRRELKTRPINECRCDERLKTKTEESTHLTYNPVYLIPQF